MLSFNLKNIILEFKIELAVFLVMCSSLFFFVGISKTKINSDGVGYYDYLPSIFIHHDIGRYQSNIDTHRIDSMSVYVKIRDAKVNKFNVGVSILQTPFFLAGILYSKLVGINNINGYENFFQTFIFFGALFYYLLSLMFFRLTLRLYAFSTSTIIISLLLFGLSTNVIQYINYEATFSHVYCMFIISALIFCIKKFQLSNDKYFIYLSSVLLGLLFITRMVDVIIILAFPFVVGSLQDLKNFISDIFKNKIIIYSGLLFSLVVSIQLLVWYLQSGRIWIDTYQNESFNFLKPEFINFWFSYRKGLFVYTPITFLIIVIGIIKINKHNLYSSISFFIFFISVSYVLSCWWNWWYSCGYGQRAFVGFYPILFLYFAKCINSLNTKIRNYVLLICILTIPVNHIQARQYRTYILDWENMNEIKYWNVFLSNSNRFIGFNWKKDYDYTNHKLVFAVKKGNLSISQNTNTQLFNLKLDSVPHLISGRFLKISTINSFENNNRTKLNLTIKEKGDTVFTKSILFTNLSTKRLGTRHRGYYIFELPQIKQNKSLNIFLNIETKKEVVFLEDLIISIRK